MLLVGIGAGSGGIRGEVVSQYIYLGIILRKMRQGYNLVEGPNPPQPPEWFA